jgi:hypothetical protein
VISLGKISEIINGMISKVLESSEFTSASPGHINTLIQINAIENPDFESEIKEIIKEETKNVIEKPDDEKAKQKKEIKGVTEKLTEFDKGNIGDVHRFTAEQFGNVKALATNPTGFMFQTFMRKFAKGAGVLALALLIFEAVKWIISELLKPGRLLDRRFRRTVEQEILAFRSREQKQKLNQGFNNIIVTSIGGLRGGQGQTFNSYRTVAAGQDLFPKNFLPPQTVAEGLPLSKNKRKRFGQ